MFDRLRRRSPALGKGVAAGAPSVDARGFARPDVAGEAVDVGAFEFQAGAPNVVFYVGTDHSITQSGPGGKVVLSGPGTILSASAVTDNAGNDDVYVITSFGRQLWEHTVAGWAMISGGSFQQISAATNAGGYPVVFAVGTDNSLAEFTPAGSIALSPAGTILSISATTDGFGNDDVFAITGDPHLWEHTPAGWQFLSAGSFQQISAGLNGAGQAVLYGVLTDNSLWEYNPAFNIGVNLFNLSPAGSILAVSAAGADQVFAVTSDHHLWQHTLAGWSMTSAGNFQSISANQTADGRSEVFGVLSDNSLWENNPTFAGDHWMNLVPSGVLSAAAPLRR